jgi:conjugal transfer pilus assembly protein TraK
MINKLSTLALALLLGSAAFAQSPGIVYPAINSPAPNTVTSPAKGPANAASAAPSNSPVKVASPPSAAASAPVASNPPVKYTDPRRLDLINAAATTKATQDAIALAADATMPDPADQPVKPAKKKPASSKSSEGPKVIRAEVSGEMARAEALAAAELPPPSRSLGATSGGSLNPDTPGVTGLSDVKPLPKWITGSLDKTSGRTQVVVLPGVTEIIRIARSFPNRLVTPFESAEVITTDENLTHDGVGGAVIVATASDRPIGIFIQDRNSDRAIPLVLIPEDIPQRDVRFILDESWGPPILRNSPETIASGALPSAQSDYVEYVKSIMRTLAKGEVPEGHALSPVQPELAPACQVPGIQMRIGQMLEGAKTRIAIYTATNSTQSTIPVQESGCYRSGVLAVSAFPRPVLEPGQDTEVYVVLRKDSLADRSNSAKRRPVLVSQ